MKLSVVTIMIVLLMIAVSCGKSGELTVTPDVKEALSGDVVTEEPALAPDPNQDPEEPATPEKNEIIVNVACPQCQNDGCTSCGCNNNNEDNINIDLDTYADANSVADASAGINSNANETCRCASSSDSASDSFSNSDTVAVDDEPTSGLRSDVPVDNSGGDTGIPVDGGPDVGLNIDYPPFIPIGPNGLLETPDGTWNNQKALDPCVAIDSDGGIWWLAYQLSGGLFTNVTFETATSELEETVNGVVVHMDIGYPETDTTIVEIDTLTLLLEMTNEYFLYTPSNVSFTYHDLAYADPVFGWVDVAGKLDCIGKSYYYRGSNKWQSSHSCIAESDLLVTYLGRNYRVGFKFLKEFFGETQQPVFTSFLQGKMYIDNVEYDIEKNMPPDVEKCHSR